MTQTANGRPDLISTLRRAWVEREAELTVRACAAARGWIDTSADPAQLILDLETLRHFRSNFTDDGWRECFNLSGRDSYATTEWLFFAMRPDSDGNRYEAGEFWEAVGGVDFTTSDPGAGPIHAFANAALEYWESLRPEVVGAS